MRILTVNAGSSSVKLSLVEGSRTLRDEALGAHVDPEGLRQALNRGLRQADAVAHRIVHGGPDFGQAVVIDGAVTARLQALTELAPLHQPKSLAALDLVSSELPDVPAVACFDTAFHSTLEPAAATYALPERWRVRWELRRYGFHGLSHSWVARRTPELLADAAPTGRIVSCHLGAGASLCAVRDGHSVDTTMGFTPLEGLVMATRSGSVDPGMLLWLLEHEGVSARELADSLEHESGLAGLAGSADMPIVLERRERGDAQAKAAIDVYTHRLRGAIAAMAASLGGLDALAFTGGVGENAAEIRLLAASGLGFLGVGLDERANRSGAGDRELTRPGAAVRTVVLRAREDLEMARQAERALAR